MAENWLLMLGLLVAAIGWVATGPEGRVLFAERLTRRAEERQRRRADERSREFARQHWASIDRLRHTGNTGIADEAAARALRQGIERPR